MASCCRGLELNDLYSRFDQVLNAPFGYTIPRDRVLVIPDSEQKAAQGRHNAQRVARLEARRAEPLSVVDQLEKQIAELQPVLSEAEKEKKFTHQKSDHNGLKLMAFALDSLRVGHSALVKSN